MLSELTPANISVDDISHTVNSKIILHVLRLDKIHPIISGNKWFKLRYYIDEAKAMDKKRIITFGGAWSNHIVATAAVCRLNGLNSVGIIRGEMPPVLSTTLQQANEMGMDLRFVSREEYTNKSIPGDCRQKEDYVIPEGGYGNNGAKGASRILDYCNEAYSHYCCAAGTGTMSAGICNAIGNEQKLIAVSVLKNNHSLEKMIEALMPERQDKLEVVHNYHFGGYAKYDQCLLDFMNDFYTATTIPSDFVYTGKLFYATRDLVNKGYFPIGSRILLIHSGGLQGNASLGKGTLMF